MATTYANCELLARAVAEDLNNNADQFAEQYTATFDVDPRVELKDLDTLLVKVRDAGESTIGIACRELSEHEYYVEIVLWKKFVKPLELAVSQLKLLGQQMADLFRFKPSGKTTWPTGRTERFKRINELAFMQDDDIDQLGAIRVRLILVFQGWR